MSEWLSFPAPLQQQQLDSPTAEHLNADWLSQLGVGKIFRQSCDISTSKMCVIRNDSRPYVVFAALV